MKVKVKSVKTNNETKQKMRQNKNKQRTKWSVVRQILCFSFSSVYPFVLPVLCPGHCLFWKVYILGFSSIEWSNVILLGTSEFQNQIEEDLSNNCLHWVFDILVYLICRDSPTFLGGKGWRCWKLDWKLSQTILCWLPKGHDCFKWFSLWMSCFELRTLNWKIRV